MIAALFWVITQRVMAISYRRFGTTYPSRLLVSKHREEITTTRCANSPEHRSSHVVRVSSIWKCEKITECQKDLYANRCKWEHLKTRAFNLLKPTGNVMHHQFNIQQLYALSTLYLCFVFIWEQTATWDTYSINWLVFITEMKSVYCAVRTGSLNKAVCGKGLNSLIVCDLRAILFPSWLWRQ